VETSRFHDEKRNTHERRNAYFPLAFSSFGKKEKKKIPTSAHRFFPPCFTALVLHLQREKSRYKLAGIDYEKHGDGVCFGDYFGPKEWDSVLREKGRWALDYLTVRLQHSRDEFPFVVNSFFFSLIQFFSYYYFLSCRRRYKDGRDEGSLSFFCSTIFCFFLMRRDDILVLKDIHYRIGWFSSFLLGHRVLPFLRSFLLRVCTLTDVIGIIAGLAVILLVLLWGPNPTGRI
jgi:hypothetical protein